MRRAQARGRLFGHEGEDGGEAASVAMVRWSMEYQRDDIHVASDDSNHGDNRIYRGVVSGAQQ